MLRQTSTDLLNQETREATRLKKREKAKPRKEKKEFEANRSN
jgi:hypothetical protein